MHAHWGSKEGIGSEHTLDGEKFDAELHIVHYNSKYDTAEEAMKHPDGLAVLGMFILTGKPHEELDSLCRNLFHIQEKDVRLTTQDILDIEKILPGKMSCII